MSADPSRSAPQPPDGRRATVMRRPGDVLARGGMATAILAVIGLTYAAVHATGGTQFAYVHLGYLPILLAAFAFGLPGGIAAALLTGFVLGPVMPLNIEMGHDQPFASWATRTGLFLLIGSAAALAMAVARRQAEAVRRISLVDPRTNLPNHAALVETLEEISSGRTGCCLLFEIADYDRVQVSFGPAHADDWARAVANALAAACPSDRILYQVRAHRFCLWLADHEVAEAIAIGSRLRDSVAPVTIRGIEMESDLLWGVAPTFTNDGQLVFAAAAAAIEIARSTNRPFAVCDDQALGRQRADAALVTHFRRALRSGEGLTLAFQPKVELATGACRSAEALLRCHHPELGAVSPARLFSLIEHTALMSETTRWVLARALDAVRRTGDPQFAVAVNVSVQDLADAHFADVVASALDDAGLTGRQLMLEITETALYRDVDTIAENLRRIREQGVRVAVDDFGSAHASFEYVKTFPIDEVKIDRAYIANLPSRFDTAVVRSAILLARELDCEVVAEGIETAETARRLAGWGCRYGQGYLFSPAVPIDQLCEFLRAPAAARRSMMAEAPRWGDAAS